MLVMLLFYTNRSILLRIQFYYENKRYLPMFELLTAQDS